LAYKALKEGIHLDSEENSKTLFVVNSFYLSIITSFLDWSVRIQINKYV